MLSDERPDWIDDALRRDAAWQPPPAFAERVVRAAVTTGAVIPEPAPLPYFSLVSRLRESAIRTTESLLLRLEGTIWVVRQYRELIWG